jgi:hypothetical protein
MKFGKSPALKKNIGKENGIVNGGKLGNGKGNDNIL